MLRCRLLGHRPRFRADGAVMRWQCQRGCGAAGSRTYETAAQAAHFAVAFDREDRDDIGRRAPWIAMFPLRLWHKARERSRRAVRSDRAA